MSEMPLNLCSYKKAGSEKCTTVYRGIVDSLYMIGTYAYYLHKVWVYVLSTKGPLNRLN